MINNDQISIIFMEIQKQLYACMIVYTIMVIIMRDGMMACIKNADHHIEKRWCGEIWRKSEHIYI